MIFRRGLGGDRRRVGEDCRFFGFFVRIFGFGGFGRKVVFGREVFAWLISVNIYLGFR